MISSIRKAALAATFLAGSAVFAYAQTSSTLGVGGSTSGSGSSSTTLGTGGSSAGGSDTGGRAFSSDLLGLGGSTAGGGSQLHRVTAARPRAAAQAPALRRALGLGGATARRASGSTTLGTGSSATRSSSGADTFLDLGLGVLDLGSGLGFDQLDALLDRRARCAHRVGRRHRRRP